MWIKLRTLMAGPEGVSQAGAVVNLPDEQAQQLVDSGQAEKTSLNLTPDPSPKRRGEKAKKETATSKQAEAAEQRGADVGDSAGG